MKVNVNVDCTPEEARRFLGLPDLSTVHHAYVEKMKSALDAEAAGDPAAFAETMMKAWGPMSEAGVAAWRRMFDQSGEKQS
jgi:hypothetical protein